LPIFGRISLGTRIYRTAQSNAFIVVCGSRSTKLNVSIDAIGIFYKYVWELDLRIVYRICTALRYNAKKWQLRW
jgi:hypothetical protein